MDSLRGSGIENPVPRYRISFTTNKSITETFEDNTLSNNFTLLLDKN